MLVIPNDAERLSPPGRVAHFRSRGRLLPRPVSRRHGWLGSLVALLLTGAMPALAAEDADLGLEAREQDLVRIEQRVKSLDQELIGKQSDRRALIEELEAREREVAALALAGRELSRLVKEHTRVATDLRRRQAEERHALGSELDLLSELVRTAYVMGRADRLRLILNQEDPVQASRILSYFAYLNRERMRRVLAVKQLLERLDQLAQDAEREAERLAQLAARQEATRLRLEAVKAQRAGVLARLEAAIASQAESRLALQQDAESLRLLIEHLRQKAQIRAELDIHRTVFRASKGKLAWPVLEGRVLAAFGTRKEDSELRWDGVLLSTREGEEVRAIGDGQILYADWLRGFGLLLAIDHGEGYLSLYGHNEALLRELGEWVTGGDVIALSGNSGGRDEPVLYFAIRRNGRPQDPATWCSRAGTLARSIGADPMTRD